MADEDCNRKYNRIFGRTQLAGEVMAALGEKRVADKADISTDDGRTPNVKA